MVANTPTQEHHTRQCTGNRDWLLLLIHLCELCITILLGLSSVTTLPTLQVHQFQTGDVVTFIGDRQLLIDSMESVGTGWTKELEKV